MFSITAAAVLAQSGWGTHMWGSGWWMAVMMVAFWGAVVWLVVTVTRSSDHHRGRDDDPRGRARALLAERLALGDIDPSEYRDRLDTLR